MRTGIATWALLFAACDSADDAPRDTIGTSDHDGDGIADAADNCPAHFNQTQPDGDGDGVGDVCDPHVAQPGDKLISASLFSTGFGDWSPLSPADWARADGAITTTADADSTSTRLTTGMSVPTPTLLVGFSVDTYGPTVVRDENNVLLALTLDNGETWSCRTFNDSAVDVRLSHVMMNANGAFNRFRILTTTIAEGASVQAAITRESTMAVCRTEDGLLPEPTTAVTPHAIAASIQVVGARMSLSYALVYGVP